MRALLLLALFTLAPACATTETAMDTRAIERSRADADPRARELAEAVVERLGGWEGWDATRYLAWNFFGGRRHVWDKTTGDWRLDDGQKTVLMNLGTRAGRVFENGVEVLDSEQRGKELDAAWAKWINDSYWMFLPWKLLDPGVKLRHLGTAALETGASAQVLELTFDGVGLTPKNRYLVHVGDESGLVEQWAFFPDVDDEAPRFTLPWRQWQRFGRIQLCMDHGALPGRENADWKISAPPEVPRAVFEDPRAQWP